MSSHYFAQAHQAQIYLIFLACISISLPTALMSIVMALLVVTWILSGDYYKKYEIIKNHPAASISVLFFLLYGIGMIYSSASWDARLNWWLKYHKLLYIPVIISVLTEEKARKMAVVVFLTGSLTILAISYLKWIGIVPHNDIGQGHIVFKGRIAHSIFMAFTMYLVLRLAVASSGLKRWIWLTVSFLTAMNVLFLVNGRTGQIILFVLMFWFCWETWGWKSVRWFLALLVVVPLVYLSAYDMPKNRLMDTRQEVIDHDPDQAPTSSGLRLEFYKNALSLIQQNPIFGAGTGSFESEYRSLAEKQETLSTYVTNPHNEYLLTAQELGVVGLLALGAFFLVPWYLSYRLDPVKPSGIHAGYAMRGLILTIAVGSLFNSLLLDAGEGRFYCVLAGVFLSGYKISMKSKDQ